MIVTLSEAAFIAAGTGAISTALTVAALRIHIVWIRETLTTHGDAIRRAHERIDTLEARCAVCRGHHDSV